VEALARGAVVLVTFPFSDLTRSKLRPAVVLADAGRGDVVLCQVTSRPYGDPIAVVLTSAAFASGSLRVTSYARPGKLFTASSDLIVAHVGVLTEASRSSIVDAVISLIQGESESTPDPDRHQSDE
jgi:mRNA interferase MazF